MKFNVPFFAKLGVVAALALGVNACTEVDPTPVPEEVLASPVLKSIVVIDETTAKINFAGKNAGDDGKGYYLYTSADTTKAVDSIALPKFTGDTSFTVAINKDVANSWIIKTYGEDGLSLKSKPASFNARVMKGPYTVTEVVAKVAGQGLAIDDSVYMTNVAAGIAEAATPYVDGGKATFYFENTKVGGVTITPINAAHVVMVDSTEILNAATIATIKTKAVAYDSVVQGTKTYKVYSVGKSPKVGGTETGTAFEMAAGSNFVVVSAAGAVARVVVTAVNDPKTEVAGTVTCKVYTPGANTGALLYKKRLL